MEYVRGKVVEVFPQSLNCNYSLIEALMCLKIIT